MFSSRSGLPTWTDAAQVASAAWPRKYFEAIYWASATLTTTGYGDVLPISVFEKAFAIICQGLGILCLNYLIVAVSRALGVTWYDALYEHCPITEVHLAICQLCRYVLR